MKLLAAFKEYGYSNEIGPGVYDIHSPRVPSEQEIKDRIKAMLELLPEDLLFINPVSDMIDSTSSMTQPLRSFRTVVLRHVVGRRQKVCFVLCMFVIFVGLT
jgi:hypothetical protein